MNPPTRVARKVSKRTRFEVLKRDGFRCRYCGVTPERSLLHVDHVIAIANGGSNAMENLATSCQPCNSGKSSVPIDLKASQAVPSAKAIREQAEQIRAYLEATREIEEARQAIADLFAEQWEALIGYANYDIKVRLLNLAGTVDQRIVMEAIRVTGKKHGLYDQTAKMCYFNGCVRKMRKDMEEANGSH